MKKSVILMAGLLAMALAGSAQAAGPCTNCAFAVQDAAGANDLMVVDKTAGWIGIGTPAPLSPFHVVSAGSTTSSGGFIYSYTNTGSVFASRAPNFSFYRNNDAAATNATNGVLPRADDALGSISFGTNVAGAGRVMVLLSAKAEGTPTATVQPGYFTISTAYDNAGAYAAAERLRINSLGNVGINTTAPTSKLHVVGLPVYATQVAAQADVALTAGAIYTNGSGALFIKY